MPFLQVTLERLAVMINELGYKAIVLVQADTEEPEVEIFVETSAGESQMAVTIPIDGMACEDCAQSVKERLSGIDLKKFGSI